MTIKLKVDMEKTELQEYPTFGALARSAMVFGIPLMPLSIIVAITVIFGMIGTMFMGLKGMLVFVISIPLLLMLRTISATDDRAINILGYEVLCLFKRRNANAFNGTTTFLATRYGRNKHDYQRLAQQNFKRTASSRGHATKAKSPR